MNRDVQTYCPFHTIPLRVPIDSFTFSETNRSSTGLSRYLKLKLYLTTDINKDKNCSSPANKSASNPIHTIFPKALIETSYLEACRTIGFPMVYKNSAQAATAFFGSKVHRMHGAIAFFGTKEHRMHGVTTIFGSKEYRIHSAIAFFGSKEHRMHGAIAFFGSKDHRMNGATTFFGSKEHRMHGAIAFFGSKELRMNGATTFFGSKEHRAYGATIFCIMTVPRYPGAQVPKMPSYPKKSKQET